MDVFCPIHRYKEVIIIGPLISFGQQVFYRSVQIPAARTPEETAAPSMTRQEPTEGEDVKGGKNGGKISGRRNFDTYECQTCRNRKYKDGSDDPGVSFKTPTHISPENAASAIRSHENEHVSHARAKALREDQKILSQSVTYHTDVCPECGRVYLSGGTTRTVFGESKDLKDLYGIGEQEQKGAHLDMTA